MKIIDLLEQIFDTEKKTVNLNRNINGNLHAYDNDAKTGFFSSVKDKKGDPFMVRKTGRSQHLKRQDDISEFDGYWKYIEGIVDNPEYKNNPFFPRVYNIKRIKGANGKTAMKADLEKLQPCESVNQEMLLNYFINLFGEEDFEWFLTTDQRYDNDNITNLAVTIMSTAIVSSNYSKIKNSHLIKALKYIAKWHYEGSYGLDLHAGNVMFRIGSHGVQMVITDPLSWKQ